MRAVFIRLSSNRQAPGSSSPGQDTVTRIDLAVPGARGDDAMNGLRSEVRVRRRAEYQGDVGDQERAVRTSADTDLQIGRPALELERSLVPISRNLCQACDGETPRNQ